MPTAAPPDFERTCDSDPSPPSPNVQFWPQTPLHYAYSYGFESFGEYLISKGADDSIANADGLTCYEGLNQDNLGQL